MSLMRYHGKYYMADAFYDGRTYRRLIKSSPSGERHTYTTIISYDSESYHPMNDFIHINESEAWLVTTKKDGNVIKKIFWKKNETWARDFDILFNTGLGDGAFCPKILINTTSGRVYCYYCRHTRSISPQSVYVRYSDNAGASWIGPYTCFDGYGPREHEPAVCIMNDTFYIFADIKGSTLNIFRSDDGLSFTNIQSFNYTNRYIFISHEMVPINDTDVLLLSTNWTTRGKDGYRANWLEHRRLNESGVFELITKFYLGDSACSGDGCIFANQEFNFPIVR